MKKQILILTTALLCNSVIAQVPNYVPTNGLVGWWPFNGNANDESGNGNNGTVNGATLTSDRFGIANKTYSFDGVSSYIEILDNNSLDVTSVSVSCWINPNDFGSAAQNHQGHIFSKRELSGWGGSFQMAVESTTPLNGIWATFTIGSNNWVNYNPTINPLTANNWIYITYTHDLNEAKLYVNGEIKSTLAINGGLLSNNIPLCFGARPNSGINGQYFNGKIDDIGIWNRALTVCEIQDLYQSELNSLAVSGGADVTICAGEVSTFSGSGASNYSWSNGISDGIPHVFTQIDTGNSELILTGTDVNGCIGKDTVNVWVNSTSFSTLTETALNSYTLNGQTYTQSGTYTQVIPNAAGCDSTITLNLSLDFTGLQEFENSFTISPNPAKDQLNVLSPSGISENYFLLDAQGRKVLTGKLTGTTTNIDISKLAAGNYLVQVGEEKMPVRIVKN